MKSRNKLTLIYSFLILNGCVQKATPKGDWYLDTLWFTNEFKTPGFKESLEAWKNKPIIRINGQECQILGLSGTFDSSFTRISLTNLDSTSSLGTIYLTGAIRSDSKVKYIVIQFTDSSHAMIFGRNDKELFKLTNKKF